MSQLSILDLFTIGIGPSSSHTVGPMRAASSFVKVLSEMGRDKEVESLKVNCYGSLAATGKGHGTDAAIIMGLMGDTPETVDVDMVEKRLEAVVSTKKLVLPWGKPIDFDPVMDVDMSHGLPLPLHPNGMHFAALGKDGVILWEQVYYSTGGGFVSTEEELQNPVPQGEVGVMPYVYQTASDLVELCVREGKSFSQIAFCNELVFRSSDEVKLRLQAIWQAMQNCVKRGMSRKGVLPGGMNIRRRVNEMHQALLKRGEAVLCDPLAILDWVNLYAMAVSEENAAGGRVVTAPTNGAAGIIPAVLHYAVNFCHCPYSDGVERFLLTAGTIGLLYKANASISGADVGCQGEVGVACSMAAGALTEYLGGDVHQVENAAEIGIEHNLGLTCDPVGGLVQIPCIERNAMGAIKAINAARMALKGNGEHFVPLDKAMRTMLETGRDMQSKYKETAQGGLAVNVVEC